MELDFKFGGVIMKKKLNFVLEILISVIFLSCENPLFVKITNLYNVDFITNGGSEVASMRTSEITQNPITEKQDAVFEGWYTTSTFVGTAIVIPYEVTENICLYAKWKEKYTVYFESNCNQQIQSYKTFIVDSIPVIEREGYYFDGWYTNQNFTGEKVSFPYSLSQNTTFYAKWIQTVTPAVKCAALPRVRESLYFLPEITRSCCWIRMPLCNILC